jgi:transglutaminase-like putative cysteine protease
MLPVRLVGAFGLCLWVGSPAQADDTLLHEYVPDVDPQEVAAVLTPTARAAVREPTESSRSGEVTSNAESAPSPQAENFRPDRLTSLDGNLDYYEVFEPSIAPFKRVMALDATRLDIDARTPVLGVYDTRHRSVPLESRDAPPPDARPRDRFAAELDVDFSSDRTQRLASVSPESRILGLQTTPSCAVLIERDGADNYYIRVVGPRPATPVHVSFVTDAPRAYFGTQIPRVPLRALPAEVPPLHPSVARRALRFAAQLGLSPKSDLRTALESLTRYFRAFVESAAPPEDTGDLYVDLVHGGKGLCRHRAYGFVVTAHALGIAARFVQNEAHSWVEVKLLGSGFLRIDLGGAAHGLTSHSAHDRANYLPAQPDTLPRPASYRESYAQAERAQTSTAPPAEANVDTESLAGRWLQANSSGAERGSEARGSSANGNTMSANAEGKTPLQVTLSDRRMSAVRGGKLVLTGRVTETAGRGVAELRVEVWIARDKRQERMLLGVSVTDADGYFRTAFGIPADLDVGDYRIVVVSQGDTKHLPVVTE